MKLIEKVRKHGLKLVKAISITSSALKLGVQRGKHIWMDLRVKEQSSMKTNRFYSFSRL